MSVFLTSKSQAAMRNSPMARAEKRELSVPRSNVVEIEPPRENKVCKELELELIQLSGETGLDFECFQEMWHPDFII